MNETRDLQLKIMVSAQEKEWLEHLARDAGVPVAEYVRDLVRTKHVELLRLEKERDEVSRDAKLTPKERWFYDYIRGNPGRLREGVSREMLDHASRVEFGDGILFELSAIMAKLREHGLIRNGEYGYQVARELDGSKPSASSPSRGGRK